MKILSASTIKTYRIRPVNVLSQIPTFELVMPLSNGKLRIVKVIDGELTATVVDK